MVTLGLVCLFVSFILLIVGLMAWGAMTPKPTTDDESAEKEMKEEPRD